eukprot:TRINITY_DN46831_c0_g1_i1.p1 TRINITY_DN46831_c0_g1~~TRINITY_DN46831_c0_g1_i1.p1  ORF type:complete len:483 (+),score=84.26 TRINITY_DN46831_c0_g1_i1:36-1451(+)
MIFKSNFHTIMMQKLPWRKARGSQEGEQGQRLSDPAPASEGQSPNEVDGEEPEDMETTGDIRVGSPVRGLEGGIRLTFEDGKDIKELEGLLVSKLDESTSVGEPVLLERSVSVSVDINQPSLFGLKGLPGDLEKTLVTSGFSRDHIEPSLEAMYLAYKAKKEKEAPTNGSFSSCSVNGLKQTHVEKKIDELIVEGDPEVIHREIKKIDSGSQGEVYRAVDASGTPVALKKINIKQATDIATLENEISLMQTCRHGNVVQYRSCYRKGRAIWIAMELMDGGKLTNVLSPDNRFTEPQVAYIMKEILKGLRHLHKGGVVHRDIKSDNILLNKSGEIKLTDFGFSAFVSSGDVSKRRTLVGTPYWMAPEVVDAKPYDYAADIWSLGILGFEICDGQPPNIDMHPMRAMKLTSKREAPKLKSRTEWSVECIAFMESMLRKEPSSRPTAKQLLAHPFLNRGEGVDPTFLKDAIDKA